MACQSHQPMDQCHTGDAGEQDEEEFEWGMDANKTPAKTAQQPPGDKQGTGAGP